MRQLLKNADILMLDGDEWSVIKKGLVGVDGDTIAYVGEQQPNEEYDSEKDMTGLLLMPGLYNTHTHTPMTLLRGLGSALPLDRWLNEAIFPLEAKLTPEDVRAGTVIALMELIASGVVSFTDMYDFPRVTAEEATLAGIKANLNRPILAFDPGEKYEDNFRVKESIAFFEEFYAKYGGAVTADFGLHAEYTSLPGIVERYASDCMQRGARMHIHLSETRKEHEECKAKYGKTPARYFSDLGVFDNPTTAAHCVYTEPEDWLILREKAVTAVHNPTSNMKLASGFMPLRALLDLGVNVGLGTDGAASNNNLNMFEEMHMAAVIHCGHTGDPGVVTPGDILKMATINGAKSQGRDSGNIEVGKRADIIALNMDAPHLMPVHDIPSLIVYSAQASDVVFNMVNGKVLYEKGEYLTIDLDRAKHMLKKALNRLF